MWAFKKLSYISKLVVINSLVILLVIFLAGLSVKDYACFLVTTENISGQTFVETLNGFLWKVSIIAFIVASLFHYVTVKKMVDPIKQLSIVAKGIKEGKTPTKIETTASGDLKELIANFNSMSETLASVQEQREEMLRDIAHELRTPLTNMNGYLEALQNEVIEGNPQLFGSLLEESKRITRIVDLITEMHTWNNGIYFSEIQLENLEINKVLTESLTAFQLRLQNHFSVIHQNIDEAYILGSQDGLMQVVGNILQNIIDYNTGKELIVNGFGNDGKYRITFTHNGKFIDPEKKDLIFERFYRLEESRSTKSDGAGLGLAIASSIITAHNGTIGVKTDGYHHTFWIEIPESDIKK